MNIERKKLLEEKIRKIIREELVDSKKHFYQKKNTLNEIDDLTDSDWYGGNYSNLEEYRRVMAKGVMVHANNVKNEILKVNLKSSDAMAKLLRYLYKNRYDTVNALDSVLKTYDTGQFNPNDL